jgi:hypothetical protein
MAKVELVPTNERIRCPSKVAPKWVESQEFGSAHPIHWIRGSSRFSGGRSALRARNLVSRLKWVDICGNRKLGWARNKILCGWLS